MKSSEPQFNPSLFDDIDDKQPKFGGLSPDIVPEHSENQSNIELETDTEISESIIVREDAKEAPVQEQLERYEPKAKLDSLLLITSVLIVIIGLFMVASSSIPLAEKSGHPLSFLFKQCAYVFAGIAIATVTFHISLENWYRASPWLLTFSIILLILVLIPGIGREINGAMRWFPLGVINAQPSEPAKLCAFLYVAGYLQRHYDALKKSTITIILPLSVLGLIGILLLLEPDFGSTTVIFSVALGMIFLAGVSLWRFGLMLSLTVGAMAVILWSQPYRRARLTAFLDPWADPFNQSFQLVQSLIAIGRGELWGVGIGGSVQKLGYLPEAHTDFIFAIFAEETGLIGVICLITLYLILIWRAFIIGARAEKLDLKFAAYVAYGIGLWFCLQSFINMAVDMGALPTKGLTLPLMSYGGSNILVTLSALAILFRIDLDAREATPRKIKSIKQVKSIKPSSPLSATAEIKSKKK